LNSASTGVNAIAIGTGAVATGSVAVGAAASAANGGAAFGDGAIATGVNATAIGPGASAAFANSSAIGSGASATAANQMALGTASNTYRMPGITSAASLAAQSGPTSFVTTDGSGNLATTGFGPQQMMQGMQSMGQSINQLSAAVSSLQTQVDNNRREARAGAALAMATSGLHYDPRPGKATLAAAVGSFQGQSGLAVGFGYAVSDRFRVNAAFSGSPQVNDYGFVAGGSWTLN